MQVKEFFKNSIDKLTAWFKKRGLFSKLFMLVALLFFVGGLASLGVANGTGESITVGKGADVRIAYDLTYGSGQKLKGVYVNVGSVYGKVGSQTTSDALRVSAGAISSGTESSYGSTNYVFNVYTTSNISSYKSNKNYNWLAVKTGLEKTDKTVYVSFNSSSSSAAARVNEVVFLGSDGNVIKATPNKAYSKNISLAESYKTLDAQGSFSLNDGYYFNFSQQEEHILNGIDQLFLQHRLEGATYSMSTDYNYFGIMVYGVFTLIFGRSTFGLRLPSFLSAFGILILIYLFMKKIFKSEKVGFFVALPVAVGGFFIPTIRLGVPLCFALFMALLSVYWAYKFFASSYKKSKQIEGSAILLSGGAFAIALCVHTPTALGCALSFGLIVAKIVMNGLTACKTAQGAEVEEVKGVEVVKTVLQENGKAIALLVLSFVVLPIILLCVFTAIYYPAYVSCFIGGAKGGQNYFGEAMLQGLKQCFTLTDIVG